MMATAGNLTATVDRERLAAQRGPEGLVTVTGKGVLLYKGKPVLVHVRKVYRGAEV
jgi:hypothetical protein